MLTTAMLDDICGHTKYADRKRAFCDFINGTAVRHSGLNRPHEMAQFLPQILHESTRMKHVREVWGPTPAQQRYEGRADLGNTRAGDGKLFLGRDLLQVTGRSNYRALTVWARRVFGDHMPNFEQDPARLEAPEFLGLGALWYWTQRVPVKYIDAGDVEMVTRRINGGLNGYPDRLDLYARTALVLLGHGPADVEAFQRAAGLAIDGIAGPLTRAALHRHLLGVDVPSRAPAAPPAVDPAQAQSPGLLARILARLQL